MKIRIDIYLITATLLIQYALIKCADVSDSNTGPSAYTTEPFDHIDHFDHLDHLDHDIGLDDHESLEQFLTGPLQSRLGKTNLNGKNKIIHSVKVIHHDGDSITKYVTTSHTDPNADDDLFDGVLMPSRQPSNTPGAYTKIMKKTIINQSNSDEKSLLKEPSSVVQNVYGKNNSKEIETGNSKPNSQTMSQTDHMTNNGVPLMSNRPIINSPDNLQNGMRTTITKIISSGNTANDLNGFANGKNNPDSKSSNKAISTMSASNSNSNNNDMVTADSSQIKPLGGDVKIQTKTTDTINGFTDAGNQGEFRKRPEDGSFRLTKTTTVKQQNSNGRDNNFGELDDRDIEYVKGNARPSKTIVYQITPLRYNQLTTTNTANTIDRNIDGISTTSSSNSNSNEHDIEFDKGNMRFSKNILSQTNPSSSTTTSTTNAVDEKSTNGDSFIASDLSGKPNNRLDKSMSLGNLVNGYGILPQMHSDEIATPSTDMKKNSNNADSFRQTQTEIMGYRGASDESHAGGSNDNTFEFNTNDGMSSLNNDTNLNYMGSSMNANGMVGYPNMMVMGNDGSMSGGYSSLMTSMGNNMNGNGYYVKRKKYNRRKYGKRGKKYKTRNKGKRPSTVTVKSSSYEIGGGRRSVARRNKSAKFNKPQDYVQTSPEFSSFSENYIVNPTARQRRRLQCSCENINELNKRYEDNSESYESNLNGDKMNDAPMRALFNQISFGPPGPPPYGLPRSRGRPQSRGPPPHGPPPYGRPPHGRPPWFRRPPRGPPLGPQQIEFINMNRPPGLLPGQSPTHDQPDQATILNGQTETMYGQQNAFSNYNSNVPQSQYLGPPNRPEPLKPSSPPGPSGPQIYSFDSIQAHESSPALHRQSSDRYQIQPPYTYSSYQEHNDIIDGADDDSHHAYDEAISSPLSEHAGTQSESGKRIIGFTQTQWNRDNGDIGFKQTGTPSLVSITTSTIPSDNVINNANSNRENTVYTKTVKTTKMINGNEPPDIDVVQSESNYMY